MCEAPPQPRWAPIQLLAGTRLMVQYLWGEIKGRNGCHAPEEIFVEGGPAANEALINVSSPRLINGPQS